MPNFDVLLTEFLSDYLPIQKNASEHTISSYCTAFKFLLIYCKDIERIPSKKIDAAVFTDDLILRYLQWLEDERSCSAATVNQRLFALHSFFRYARSQMPQYYMNFSKILNIPKRKATKHSIGYIDTDSMAKILAAPDTTTKSGRRDMTLLCLMYDTGARVSEIADLSIRDVRLDHPAKIRLLGKGSKYRDVPILSNNRDLLKSYMLENLLMLPGKADHPLFFNRSGGRLTRAGVAYILNKYASDYKTVDNMQISPHILRHTKAMHLLQAGVNIVYIRDFLGHADISTTEVYARADLSMKEQALESVNPLSQDAVPIWQKDSDLLNWLDNFSKLKR